MGHTVSEPGIIGRSGIIVFWLPKVDREALAPMNEQVMALQSRPDSEVDDEKTCLRNVTGKGTAKIPAFSLLPRKGTDSRILSQEPGKQGELNCTSFLC